MVYKAWGREVEDRISVFHQKCDMMKTQGNIKHGGGNGCRSGLCASCALGNEKIEVVLGTSFECFELH